MTNEPGFRMILGKLKQQLEAFLKVFNVSLPAAYASQPNSFRAADSKATSDVALEIGNELLITDDIIKTHQNLLNVRGRVVIIDQIPATANALIRASAFGIQVYVGLNEAQQMRAAYIFREQTSTFI
jgi:hypothetical protein